MRSCYFAQRHSILFTIGSANVQHPIHQQQDDNRVISNSVTLKHYTILILNSCPRGVLILIHSCVILNYASFVGTTLTEMMQDPVGQWKLCSCMTQAVGHRQYGRVVDVTLPDASRRFEFDADVQVGVKTAIRCIAALAFIFEKR